MAVSEKSKVFYLFFLVLFLLAAGVFWLDYIGLININSIIAEKMGKKPVSVLYAGDDEPSLVQKEEFEKEKAKLQERIADLDRREAQLSEQEKIVGADMEKIKEMKDSIELEKKKIEEDKNKNNGYKKNIADLAGKIENMSPEDSVAIMINWEDPMIIDVLRQMDQNATNLGRPTITPYLISLMPKEKASRIMYLMTQL